MNYEKFLKDLQFTKDDRAKYNLIKNHVKTNYIDYQTKVVICKSIVKSTWEEQVQNRIIYKKDTPMQYLFFVMKLVEQYTDIEFEAEKIYDAYNALNQADVFELLFSPTSDSDSLISQKEYKEFQTILNMCNDDYYENFRSLGSILETKLEAFSLATNAISEAFKEVLENNGDSVSVLQS
jgi:hypothetical protein